MVNHVHLKFWARLIIAEDSVQLPILFVLLTVQDHGTVFL